MDIVRKASERDIRQLGIHERYALAEINELLDYSKPGDQERARLNMAKELIVMAWQAMEARWSASRSAEPRYYVQSVNNDGVDYWVQDRQGKTVCQCWTFEQAVRVANVLNAEEAPAT